MKLYKSLFLAMFGAAALVGTTSCDGYDYDSDLSSTEITSFAVKTPAGVTYNGRVEGDQITVFLYPFVDAEVELKEAYPVFYLPMGATCSPSPAEVQNFSKEVKYTVTSGNGKHSKVYYVNYGPSDPVAEGEGICSSMVMAEKLFPELGYPGKYAGYDFGLPSQEYGDLLLSVGFCGEKLVGFSRIYGWGTADVTPNADYAIKVWDAATLQESGTLNLGTEVKTTNIINVTNDSKGHLVAATGGLNGAESKVYYWTSLTEAPKCVGTLAKPAYTSSVSYEGAMFIQVVGDITGDAAISYLNQKTSDGQFEVAYVRGGAITTSKTITTGYPSNEGPQEWQMISLYDETENSNYLVGLSQGEVVNGSIFGYYKSQSGQLLGTMGNYMNGKTYTDGVGAWINMGNKLSRPGGRRPFMMAMTFNGKRYSECLNGYDWDNYNMFMDETMSMMYYSNALSALTHDLRKYTESVRGSAGISAGWSFGSTGCWCWNQEENIGYVAIWQGREGMATFRVTSYQ